MLNSLVKAPSNCMLVTDMRQQVVPLRGTCCVPDSANARYRNCSP